MPSVTITPSALELTDVADVMQHGSFDPSWLLRDWLYTGAVHWIAGPPGEGKTWLALHFCAQLIKRGENVLYLDEENNARIMAERLLAFGCTPKQVSQHFRYALNPGLDERRLHSLYATLTEVRPALTVFDASADFLAILNRDENNAGDVTGWIARVIRRPLADFDGAAVVLDHMPHEGHRARGSGAKKAKPEVAYIVTAKESFNRRQVGRVAVELDKDREGWLPFRREIRIGASDHGFVFEELPEGVQITRVSGNPTYRKVAALLDDEWRKNTYFAEELGLGRNAVTAHLDEAVRRGEAETKRDGEHKTAPQFWRRAK